jgi:hypothetical protein
VATSSDRALLAKLLGDLSGYSQPPELSGKVLFVPATAADLSSADRWLLVDRARVSFTGDECDKVGTGFAAFRHQPNACARGPGTCLRGQLKDLLDEDGARAAAGLAPLYSVKQFAHGAGGALAR